MELRHIRYFLAVADTLSFTRAAERLRTSQPSLSQQIRALEREVGRELFVRTSRNVALTPAGERFAAGARRTMEELQGAVADARIVDGGPDRQVRVGFLVAAEILLLPALLPAVRAAEPDLRIELSTMTSRQQLDELEHGRIDVGFLRPPVESSRLHTRTVMEETINVVIGADHPLARCEYIAAETLTRFPIVGVSDNVPGLQHAIRGWSQRRDLRLDLVHHADNVVEYMSLVRLGTGIGLLPTFADNIMLAGLISRPIQPDPPVIGMVMAYRAECTKPTQRFLDAAERAVKNLRFQANVQTCDV